MEIASGRRAAPRVAAAEPVTGAQCELVEILQRLAPEEGFSTSAWPDLRIHRSTRPIPPSWGVVGTPCLCLVAQGSKVLEIEGRSYTYDPLTYLVTAAPLSQQVRIPEASPERPFLSMALAIEPALVGELLAEMDGAADPRPAAAAAHRVFISRLEGEMQSTVLRFLRCLGDPVDRRVLAPLVLREIVYLLLRHEQGGLLRSASYRNGGVQRVVAAIRTMEQRYREPLPIAALARSVGMGESSFHRAFKATTSLSPNQYLKQLRLQQARLLLVHEGRGAGEAAFEVGYSSASQFSRDFKRFYGETPALHARRRRTG